MNILSQKELPDGVRYARLTGIGFGLFLLLKALFDLIIHVNESSSWLIFKGCFFIYFAILILLPWLKISIKSFWKQLYIILTISSITFVFMLVFDAIFNYIAMIEVGRKPGLPAFEGTLIFMALLQVPTILFVRSPELLD